MERAFQKPEIPCVVMVHEVMMSSVKMIKVTDYCWIVAYFDYKNPFVGKAVLCISFEHAHEIFDGCVDRLTEWTN